MTKTFLQRGVCRAALIAAATLVVSAGASRAADKGLTGNWVNVDTGDTVSIRQVGDEVWWVSRSKGDGKDWTDVFHGKLKVNELTGHFADVPEGKNRNQGSYLGMVIVKDDGNTLVFDQEITLPDNKTLKTKKTLKRAD